MMKQSSFNRISAFFATLFLVLSVGLPASADDAYNAELTPVPQNGALFIIGDNGANEVSSTLIGRGEKWDGPSWMCSSPTDPKCTTAKTATLAGRAILPRCDSETDTNCIVSLQLSTKDGVFEEAKYIRNIAGATFPEHKSTGFMEQSTVSLWDAPGVPSKAGYTGYAVIVKVWQDATGRPFKFKPWDINASVIPYREELGKGETPYAFEIEGNPVNGVQQTTVAGGGHSYECAWAEDGVCGVMQDFTNGTRVKLTIRISNEVGGWFKGRIKDPQISVQKFSSTNNLITVEAEPAEVARFAYMEPDVKNLTAKQKSFVKGFAGSWDGFVTWSAPGPPGSFEFLEHFRKYVNDTASGVNTFWNYSSAGYGNSGCLADRSRVLGIVTTNSMLYDGGVPKFSGGFLNYKVAGLHYMPDGQTEVIGTYDLVMRSDVARCLYNFNKAPVSATVSVTGGSSQNVATTVVSEKNGWLKLAAYGFNFSQKTIKVKLSQKKSSIICVNVKKDKLTKKVTNYNPSCPSGFKRK